MDEARIPRATYSHPEVPSVGLDEAAARATDGDDAVETLTYDLGGNGKSQILMTQGFVKLVRQKDGPVVGVHMVGDRVGELIGEAQLIYNWEAHVEDVAPLVHAHPTQNEGLGAPHTALARKTVPSHSGPQPDPLPIPRQEAIPTPMATEVNLPELGESVTEGTVTRWLKQIGDQVAVDEPLLEVSTDKVDTEIPSPVAGTLLEIKVAEDETVEVGAELAIIGSGDAAPAQQAEPQQAAQPAEPQQAEPQQAEQPAAPQQAEPEPAPQQEAPQAPAPQAPAPAAPAAAAPAPAAPAASSSASATGEA